jgi:hypothetical protein
MPKQDGIRLTRDENLTFTLEAWGTKGLGFLVERAWQLNAANRLL